MAVSVNMLGFALLGGLLFASLFTLPLALTALRGIHASSRKFFARATYGSPFLTAVLLYGALYTC